MDQSLLIVGALAVAGLVLGLVGLFRTRADDASPIFLIWAGCLVLGIAAYMGQELDDPFDWISQGVLHILIPIVLVWFSVTLGIGYAREMSGSRNNVNVFGRGGSQVGTPTTTTDPATGIVTVTPAPPANQWDFAVVIYTGVVLAIITAVCLAFNGIKDCWDSLPTMTKAPPTAAKEIYKLAGAIDKNRGAKPLGVQAKPFRAILYPADFPPTDLANIYKKLFDADIVDLNLEVDELKHIKYIQDDESLDVVAHFTTKSTTMPPTAIPKGFETMTVRLTAETPLGVDAWLAEQVLPYVKTLTPSTPVTRTAPSGTAPAPSVGVPVKKIVFLPPTHGNRRGGP